MYLGVYLGEYLGEYLGRVSIQVRHAAGWWVGVVVAVCRRGDPLPKDGAEIESAAVEKLKAAQQQQ